MYLVKEIHASQVPLAKYSRFNDLPSPIDLSLRWEHSWGHHVRFFALDGEETISSTGGLSRSMSRCLAELQVVAPHGAKYTSHSIRIGSHTEQMLWGIQMKVSLKRLG